jgi:nicotinamidase-related amidase
MIRCGSRFTFGAVAAMLGFALAAGLSPVGAELRQRGQPAGAEQGTPIPGLSRQPSAAAREVLLDPGDTVVLLLDHQTGLFQTVKDVPVAELRNNTVALANIAKLGKAPIIYTASEPNGPNGPLMDELGAFEDYAQYVPRKGEISAWDNADFVRAVEATGRKTLVIAGVWTSVCVAFPALQAKADGYKVYFVSDASGDPSVMASQTTLARLTAAGIIPVTTNAVLCEFQRTWNSPDAAQWGGIYQQLVPHYKAVAESYQRAQDAARQPK